jgi:hypothetical protein
MSRPQDEAHKTELLNFLSAYENDHIVILLTGMGLKMKGIYKLDMTGDVMAVRVWGAGPHRIRHDDVGAFWKYISGTKTFDQITTKHFTQTTDCISLTRAAEPKAW